MALTGAMAKWFGPREAVVISAGVAAAWMPGTALRHRVV